MNDALENEGTFDDQESISHLLYRKWQKERKRL